MARAGIFDPKRHTAYEPLYDIHPQTGARIEIFYGDRAVATAFGMHDAGWFWWTCRVGSLPDAMPAGPFPTSYAAFRKAAYLIPKPSSFGRHHS